MVSWILQKSSWYQVRISLDFQGKRTWYPQSRLLFCLSLRLSRRILVLKQSLCQKDRLDLDLLCEVLQLQRRDLEESNRFDWKVGYWLKRIGILVYLIISLESVWMCVDELHCEHLVLNSFAPLVAFPSVIWSIKNRYRLKVGRYG